MTTPRPADQPAPRAGSADEQPLGGRYRILEKIGEGGAAEVFLALDLRLDRHVAVKLLRPQYSHEQASRDRFAAEARAAAGLSHQNIANVFDFGSAPDGSLFLVMQHIDGLNLAQILALHGRLSEAHAVEIGREVCDALAAAHASNLIHRDAKPQNIMIDRRGTVRLTDFGIVKALSATTLTQAGMAFGTAAYLAPEQATGGAVGPATDLYALGCVLYEMLAGTPPFTGDNAASVAYQQAWEEPPPLRERRSDISVPLEAIVMRCLQKDPTHRYPSAEALADALRSLVARGAVPPATSLAGLLEPPTVRPSAQRQVPESPARSGNLVPVGVAAGGLGSAYAMGGAGNEVTYVGADPDEPEPWEAPRPATFTGSPVRVARQRAQRRRGLTWLPAVLLLALGGGIFLLTMRVVFGFFGDGGDDRGGTGVGGSTPTPSFVARSTVRPTATEGVVIVPVDPTASPSAIPTLPPTPSPTETPAPTDTLVPTPEPPVPTPRVTRPPRPTPEPTRPPRPTPEPTRPPEPTPTPEPPAGDQSVEIPDSAFSGGFRAPNGYHGRTATWVYGQASGYSSMTASIRISGEPRGRATLTLIGLDAEGEQKLPIRILLNGAVLYEGPDPLPNDDCCGSGGPGNWGGIQFEFPSNFLESGRNTLTIVNLDPSGCTNCPKFVMIDRGVLEYRSR